MLQGYDIVYFGPDAWEGLWRNRQHLMSGLAAHNRVLYVEGRPKLRRVLTDLRRGRLRLADLARPALRRLDDNLYAFRYPLWAPLSGQRPMQQVTGGLRRAALRRALRQLGMTRPIVWFHRPSMVDLLDEVPEPRLRVYHVVDEYSEYGRLGAKTRQRLARQEQEMLSRVDAVVVVSRPLLEARQPLNPNVLLLPNGVNYRWYSQALENPVPPPGLQAIPRPRLGYIGLISDKLNLGLIMALAQGNPEWSLVFLGDVQVDSKAALWHALLALPNVHYLGLVSGDRVPQYVIGFDVGLLLYEQGRRSDFISPIKLYDYLAAGIPVAGLDIPPIREFGDCINIASTPEDFARAVRDALADQDPARREGRRRRAAQHSWEARVEQLSRFLEQQLAKKASQ